MLLLITGALVETLTKHMFQKYLNERDKIEIGGAPSWYMKSIDDEMCVFTHKQGNLDTIEISKENARLKMVKKINGTIDIVVYENVKNITNDKEKVLVEKWKIDSNLPVFVNKHLNFSRVTYEDEINTTFVRACIANETIINYQKERLQDIKKEVLKFKSKTTIDEMENDLSGTSYEQDPNDPFSELPK
ncbi:MAG: hypothetical protein WBG69_01960 [Arcobacteraceae bacterium]